MTIWRVHSERDKHGNIEPLKLRYCTDDQCPYEHYNYRPFRPIRADRP